MIDLEELTALLSQSPHFRNLVEKEVRCCVGGGKGEGEGEQLKLQGLVKEIQVQMSAITQYALQEENGHRYIELMSKSEQMCLQIEKRVRMEMEERLRELGQQIEEIKREMSRTFKDIKNIPSQPTLKQQRKTITNSILQTSRIFKLNGKTKSTIDPRCMVNPIDTSQLQNQSKGQSDMLLGNSSCSYRHEGSCFGSCESNKENRQISTAVDKLKKDNILIGQKFREVEANLEAKIENNLQGVWNVLGDLNTRMSKYQSVSNLLELPPPDSP